MDIVVAGLVFSVTGSGGIDFVVAAWVVAESIYCPSVGASTHLALDLVEVTAFSRLANASRAYFLYSEQSMLYARRSTVQLEHTARSCFGLLQV